ncbi:MAG: polyprenyl synthetase family protein [Acidobacteria bacterium]|nr:polyprenyl synthetase family protein [Acidobacteriota bacterium]
MNQQDIYELVRDGLRCVEEELACHARSEIHLVDAIGRYIQDSGGKRVRPALLLLSSRLCGYEGHLAYKLGAVVELIHAATLVHDDIIDDAKVRRGRASVNARWGNEITVLMGDWLYMTSFHLALSQRHFRIMDILTDVTRKMIEGELIQLSLNGSLDITEEQHLDISRRKTAFLFAACSEIGAILGSAGGEREELLRHYGLNIGIAFQMVDDVLDFTSDETTLGKPVGSDLREGKLTLPLIYLLRDGNPQYREMVRRVLGENGSGREHREAIIRLVRHSGSVDRVLAKAYDYAMKARSYLVDFPECEARSALMAIPEFIVRRDH